jgi:sec-independent protein translocase protein TatA
MGPIGPMELIVILVIALLVLGPKKLPEVGKSLGKGMREFKDSISSANPFDEDEAPVARPAPSQVAAAPAPVVPPVTPATTTVEVENRDAQDAFGQTKS